MPVYPNLSDTDLNNLYGYIKNESGRSHIYVPDNGIMKCMDSCFLYHELKNDPAYFTMRLKGDSNYLKRRLALSLLKPDEPADNDTISSISGLSEIQPLSDKTFYYQFSVSSFGWCNIDRLIDEGPDSKLLVFISGKYKGRFNIFLAIPGYNALVEGGPAENEDNAYAFYKKDGTLPLPQNIKAYIIVVGKYEGQVIYAAQEFITRENQRMPLQPELISEALFNKKISALKPDKLNIKEEDRINTITVTREEDLINPELFKPKNATAIVFYKALKICTSQATCTINKTIKNLIANKK